MAQTKRFIWKYIIICVILFLMSGCQKQEIQRIDDSRYIVDKQMILILCEDLEAGSEYTDILNSLKGNGDKVLAAMEQLKGLNPTVAVKNAIGVANILLRNTDEAELYLQEALQETENPTEKAILLSNLAAARFYRDQYIKQYDAAVVVINEAVEEYQKDNTDMVLRMVLESNQIRINMMKDYPQPMIKHVRRLKNLLKEERKEFGANQFIGMLNLQSLGMACHCDGEETARSLDYMEEAINLNHKLYQYVFFDIHMYNNIADMYYFIPDSMEKELEYLNRCIELLDEWQSDWHYDRLQVYSKRGQSYCSMGELEKSAEDFNLVIEQRKQEDDLVAMSYYYLGQIELMEHHMPEPALDYMLRGFGIWQRYNRPNGLQAMKTSIQNIYDCYGYEKENPNFESWLTERVEAIQKNSN